MVISIALDVNNNFKYPQLVCTVAADDGFHRRVRQTKLWV